MKMEDIKSAEEEDEPEDIPEGFHLHEESRPLHKHETSREFPGLPMTNSGGL